MRTVAFERKISHQQFIEEALHWYIAQQDTGSIQPSYRDEELGDLAPDERRIVLAVLLFLRDDNVPEQFERVLECFLADYLKQVKSQRGRKRA